MALPFAFCRRNRVSKRTFKVTLGVWGFAWGLAKGLAQGDSLFNEAIERKWVTQWLFCANSIRYASPMGGADYGVFANGRYLLSANLQELLDYVGFLGAAQAK